MRAYYSRMGTTSKVVSVMRTLAEIADVRMGYPFRSRVRHDISGDVTVIQMKDIDDANLLHVNGAIKTALPGAKAHHLLRKGDLLFRSRGRSNGAGMVTAGIGPAVLAAPMLLIRPHPDAVLPAYLGWLINAPDTQAQLAAMAEGTSVRMISTLALKNLELPLPDMKRQRQIVEAAILSNREQALMAAIAFQRQRLITNILMQFAHKADQ